jgi:U3 small nucleolar RNA-associated protein 4
VSLAWGIPKPTQSEEGWEWRDSYLITGNSDSSFRKWELPGPSTLDGSRQGQGRVVLKSRAVVEKAGKMKGKKVGGKGTIVWGVGVLP